MLVLSALRSVAVVVACATLTVTVAGCDHDAATGDAVPTTSVAPDASTVRGELAAAFAGDHGDAATAAEASCFGRRLLREVSLDGLISAGLIGSDGHVATPVPTLDRTTATAWVTAQEACLPFSLASTRALSAQSKGRLDAATYRRCFDTALRPEQRTAALVDALVGNLSGDAVSALAQAQQMCAKRALPRD